MNQKIRTMKFIEQQRKLQKMTKEELTNGLISVSTYNRYVQSLEPNERLLRGMLNRLGFDLIITILDQ